MQNRLTSLAFVAAVVVSIFALALVYVPTQATAAQNNGNGGKGHGGENGKGNGADRGETGNDLFVKVAKRHPGFGGVFINEKKDITYVYLRDRKTKEAKEVAEDLEDIVFDQNLPDRVKTLHAKYSFLKLNDWFDRLAKQVARTNGVTFLDINEANNQLLVGVENTQARNQVEKEVKELDIPEKAVKLIRTGSPQLLSSLNDRHRPVVGGLQIEWTPGEAGFRNLCTLGVVAKRTDIDPTAPPAGQREDIKGFVTNSHCSTRIGANSETVVGATDSIYYQPLQNGTNQIGTEDFDPTFFRCFPAFLPFQDTCRWSDSLFAELEKAEEVSAPGRLGFIARPKKINLRGAVCFNEKGQPVSPEFCAWNENNTYRIVRESGRIASGTLISKVGARTGQTVGITLLTWPLEPTSSEARARGAGDYWVDQFLGTYQSEQGDSGAPVIRFPSPLSGDDTALVGINHSGIAIEAKKGDIFPGSPPIGRTALPASFYSPIQGVEADLGPLNTCARAVGPC